MLSEEGGSRHQSSRRALQPGEWACVDAKCANINSERHQTCKVCGKAKPRPKTRSAAELGKDAAEKSKGLFSANDWSCTKCGNVNWARRNVCNVCNAKRFGDTEERTGFGGGFNDRQNVEYIERKDTEEYDDFGRKKRKKEFDANQSKEFERDEDGQLEDEEEDSGDEDDLGKYDFTDLSDVKISIDLNKLKQKSEEKEEIGSVGSSDCSCSCSGGECSCDEEIEDEIRSKRPKKEDDRNRDYRRSPPRSRHDDRDRRHDRDRERRRSRERNRR